MNTRLVSCSVMVSWMSRIFEGGRFVDEVLDAFREPLGNWMMESSFRTEDHWLKKFGPPLPP
jgi:hypothetical protein